MSGKIQSIGIPKSSQNVEGMIGSEKFGESHSAYGEKSAIQSVPKYQIRRMVFNSATATVKTSLSNCVFNLSSPLYNVVYIDWAQIYHIDSGCLLQLQEVPTNSVTANGQSYFASLIGGSTQNLLVMPHKAIYQQPITVSRLTFQLSNLISTDPAQTHEWSIELYFYIAA